ncbi:MAG: 30S ribosome-binding factor RbfA [Dehalococcoidia bacterium]|nr:30S ribosome-binding factor RbfA [Dehalococcoidia bacterium]
MSRRTEQVGGLLQSEIAELLLRHVKHPVLAEAMLSITRVDVAQDFSNARVHVSVVGPVEQEQAVIEALEHSEPFMHRELVKRLRMRRVPRLRFRADHSIAEGARITALMREVSRAEGRALWGDADDAPAAAGPGAGSEEAGEAAERDGEAT